MAKAAAVEKQSDIKVRIARVHLRSTSPYSQGRGIETARNDTQPADAHDEACWRERIHQTKDGHVFIPPTAFKNCLAECAKFLSLSVPGKGKATYTKHFEAGVMVTTPLVLDALAKNIEAEKLFVPADGKRGSGKRVWRRFPKIEAWEGVVEFVVYDQTITEDAFERHIKAAGIFIGIGRFRPRNNGFYGRFEVLSIEWTEVT